MEKKEIDPCYAISPIDGRYIDKTRVFGYVFSEFALMKDRVFVEIEYLISVLDMLWNYEYLDVDFPTDDEIIKMRSIEDLDEAGFYEIKKYEKTTYHDVKAVEYFIRAKLKDLGLERFCRFVHIGKTSEDINNVSYAIGLLRGINLLLSSYENVYDVLKRKATGQSTPMLPLTHGQPAVGSTIEWTMDVYAKRVEKQISNLEAYMISVKFCGATGGDNALNAACPKINWRKFNEMFFSDLEYRLFKTKGKKFEVNHFTFQIEPHDTYKEAFDKITSMNLVLLDISQNMWTYISMEYFVQKMKEGEIGSSAMPHKVNPIDFENAEGNLVIANSLFNCFSGYLPLSRGYRHLSDSTVIRNFGVAFAHTYIAVQSLIKGFGKIEINKDFLYQKLDKHWEIISEGIQTILKKYGVEDAYEVILKEVRGEKLNQELILDLIYKMASIHFLDQAVIDELKSLTPHNYLGNRKI